MGIAKRLSRRYEAQEVRACLRYLISQHWRTGPLDLARVEASIEAWVLNGRPESQPPPRRRPQPVANRDDEFDYAKNMRCLSGARA